MWTVTELALKTSLCRKIAYQQRGSALTYSIAGAAVLAVTGYMLVGLLGMQKVSREDEVFYIQSQQLVNDLAELGLYVLAYDKVVSAEKPFEFQQDQKSIIFELLDQPMGSLELRDHLIGNVCGGYDVNANQVGNLLLGNSTAFCPFYIRDPSLDGFMLEDIVFKLWRTSGSTSLFKRVGNQIVTQAGGQRQAILRANQSDEYVLEADLTHMLSQQSDSRFLLHVDQNFIQSLRALNPQLTFRYKFHRSLRGYKTIGNERLVTVESELSYGESFRKKWVRGYHSVIYQIPAIKDFALFFMYPETSQGMPTRKLSESLILGGKNTQVYGRVFFNGDIDVDVRSLPVFSEAVIISGEIIQPPDMSIEEFASVLSQKFPKGLVERFPVHRLVYDNSCSDNFPAIINQTQLYCRKPGQLTQVFNIEDYILGLTNICSYYPVSVSSGNYSYDLSTAVAPIVRETCAPSSPGKLFIAGGVMNVNISGSHAFILSPVKRLQASGATTIYGTVMGGYLNIPDGSKVYGLGKVRKGLPGIADDEVLKQISIEGSRILSGVGVPLRNLPLFSRGLREE
jgi:hypothetical protein